MKLNFLFGLKQRGKTDRVQPSLLPRKEPFQQTIKTRLCKTVLNVLFMLRYKNHRFLFEGKKNKKNKYKCTCISDSHAYQLHSTQSNYSCHAVPLQDLAARNVLVDRDETTKVADFGLSRETVEDVYEVTKVCTCTRV